MIAIDTNIVVRLIVDDDAVQVAKARRLLETEAVMVSATVLLESEWVLRSAYGLSHERAARTLRAFCGLAAVHLDDEERIARALDLSDKGMDFADALHVAAAVGIDGFVTFDRALRRKAARILDTIEVREP